MISIYFWKAILEHCTGLNVANEINTTLNEKFKVYANETLTEKTMPKLRYAAIGNGGVGATMNAHHNYQDTCLFNHLPFRIRPINDDLIASDQIKYRFKVKTKIKGNDYYLYYLKSLPNIADVVNIKTISMTPGKPRADINKFDYNNPQLLNPTPQLEIPVNKQSTFNVVESKLLVELTYEEKADIKKAYQLMYDKTDFPRITEIGIFTGEDRVVNNSVEAIGVRSAVFYNVPEISHNMINDAGNTIRYIDVGAMRLA